MTLPRPCRWPGCPEIVSTAEGFCDRHRRERWRRQDQLRPGYRSRRPKNWEQLRRIVLARDPVCTICGQAPSSTVDHIVDRGKTRSSEIVPGIDDFSNLRGVCRSCHSRKTMRQHLAGRTWR